MGTLKCISSQMVRQNSKNLAVNAGRFQSTSDHLGTLRIIGLDNFVFGFMFWNLYCHYLVSYLLHVTFGSCHGIHFLEKREQTVGNEASCRTFCQNSHLEMLCRITIVKIWQNFWENTLGEALLSEAAGGKASRRLDIVRFYQFLSNSRHCPNSG